jgi:hypothetical protein
MKKLFIPASLIFLFNACHPGNSENTAPGAGRKDTAKKNYLPVADYILSEISAVDSFPLRLMKYHTSGRKTDSGIITTPVFDQLAREFLMTELDSSYFENNFEENSFVDRSTNLVSFTYSTKDTGNGLKRVDVLLSPGEGVDRLNSIYMESISSGKDSTLIRKLSWKAGKSFRILHILKVDGGPESTNQTMVVWDSRE